MDAVLTLNAGSSSLKFSVYEAGTQAGQGPAKLLGGQIEPLGPAARLTLDDARETRVTEIGPAGMGEAIGTILVTLERRLAGRAVVAVGHRIVHGGAEFDRPVRLTPDVLKRLEAFEPLAPLHQPHNLAGVAAAEIAFPDALQVGCFDTAFHRGHPWVNDTFALPAHLYEEGVRRYGFHGLSYDYIASRLAEDWPELARGRVVVAHLGNGASMCAMSGGRSIASTMGFSALDGLPMGTRSGQLDPGVLLYLLEKGEGPESIARMLYRESGLLGLSGISHDMRTLLASSDPAAARAIEYYTFRIRREIGAMAAALGGIDGLVFTGGVGRNAAPVRTMALAGLDFLGLKLDPEANRNGAERIGIGAAEILALETDEEGVIARACFRTIAAD
ncbi:acetate/propionate family kinase [Roseicyclus sp. F158]|uniref:Acetate kinase n=1 Tax=Tropicimonas omnivorans TaxID=3075590 RepID=A0ABU3DGV7_9RHOB|nr:acetate/propionate family kinase [Roseicyclus sp. F158]MDT0682799.1 acetate/propionate family kinase [Roseicyclus sp. F158]